MPSPISFVMIILGYGLLYTGLMDFSGNNVGLFQAFGYTGSKKPGIDNAQYTYKNPVANMSGQPATVATSGLTGSTQVGGLQA